MTIELEVQVATSFEPLPGEDAFRRWAETALSGRQEAQLAVRLVGREESRQLNGQYRGIDKPTNVLSFPADLPGDIGIPLLGDLVICAPLVESEALEQGKAVLDHWAHLTVHGILHLLGYDHQDDSGAREMESLEIRLLQELGVPDPYN
jgi:probable rRNA maturation factor